MYKVILSKKARDFYIKIRSIIMIKNEVLEELYKIKEDYAKSFNYDLDLIVADLQKKQEKSNRKFVYKSLKTNKTYI
jgi:hypothetical protein